VKLARKVIGSLSSMLVLLAAAGAHWKP